MELLASEKITGEMAVTLVSGLEDVYHLTICEAVDHRDHETLQYIMFSVCRVSDVSDWT